MLSLCMFFMWAQTQVEVHLVDRIRSDFDGWTLVLDSGHVVEFESTGRLELAVDQDNRTYEIYDGRQRLRYVGSWENPPLNERTIDVSGTAMGIHEVVSGKRTEQDVFDAPAEITVINPSQEITRSAIQPSDWLKEEAEILIQKTNLGGGSPIVRGMSGNRVLLMLDGFRLNNSIFRLGLNQYLNTVPSAQLQQIEVLQGPSGTQYGSDGLGGTVHLRTKDPLDNHEPALGYTGFLSSADLTQTHQVDGQLKRSQWAIQGHFKWSDLQDLEAAAPVNDQSATGYESWDASLQIALDVGSNRRIRLANSIARADNVPRTDRIQSGRDLVWDYDPQILQTHMLRFEGQQLTPVYDYFDVGIALFRQEEGTRRVSSRSPNEQEETHTAVETAQIAVTLSKVLGPISLNYGFDAQRDSIDSSGQNTHLLTGQIDATAGKFPDDASYRGIGVFAIGDLTVSDNHGIQLGVRQSWVSIEGMLDPIGFATLDAQKFTPSLAWRGNFSNWTVTSSISQGFRTPNIEDAFSVGFSSVGFDAPNPQLGPETVWNYELGLRWRTQQHQFQITTYTARFEDLIERVPGQYLGESQFQGESVFVLNNVGRAQVDGISVSGITEFGSNLELQADLAWTEGTQTDLNEPMTRIPPFRGNLDLNGQWRKHHGTFSVNWSARQDRLSQNDINDSRIPVDGTPGFVAFHLRYATQLTKHLGIKAAVENLFDRLYKMHGSGIYEPGQRFTLSLRATL